MNILTVLFIVAFVAMIAMHLRGHGGHSHGGRRDDTDTHTHTHDITPPGTQALDPGQPVGVAESRSGHGGHRHRC